MSGSWKGCAHIEPCREQGVVSTLVDASQRRFELGLSVESLAEAWARRDQGPHGAAVVVDREIAGRLRGGPGWAAAEALAVGVVARPRCAPEQVDVAWIAASLAALEVVQSLVGEADVQAQWPDVVSVGEVPVAWATVRSQLGPGVISFVVLTVRLDVERLRSVGAAVDRSVLTDALTAALRRSAELLDDGGSWRERYAEHCSTLDSMVHVDLLPKGYARGRAARVDEQGHLVLESPTGLLDIIGVDAVRRVTAAPR